MDKANLALELFPLCRLTFLTSLKLLASLLLLLVITLNYDFHLILSLMLCSIICFHFIVIFKRLIKNSFFSNSNSNITLFLVRLSNYVIICISNVYVKELKFSTIYSAGLGLVTCALLLLLLYSCRACCAALSDTSHPPPTCTAVVPAMRLSDTSHPPPTSSSPRFR